MDTGASSYLNNSVNSLSENFNTCMYPSISIGDVHSIHITNKGHSILPTPLKSLHLNNVLITPHIVKNLIYVCQFVRDNNCTIEFDAFGFSVKDFMTRRVLLRCDSMGDLYPVTAPSLIPHAFLVSQHTWHQHLGHPRGDVLRRLVYSNFISCNKEKPPVLCHAFQLSKHVRLLFVSSSTMNSSCFDIIQLDVWTSPIPSLSDGTLNRYNACLVENGSTQLEGGDVDETFSPVVKPGTIQTVLSLAASRHWPIHQLDVKNDFLHGLFLSQKKYVVEILDRAHMVNCNPSRTPIDTESKLGSNGDPVSDLTLYRSLAGSLQYLTFTQPDISYAVQQIWLLIQMQIRLVALLLDVRLQVTVYFLATTYYLGPLSVSRRFLVPVKRQLPMLLLRLVGYVIYCVSCIFIYLPLRLSIVKMLVLFIYPAIRFSISIQSILR
ncbi:ribonuclease H-like domain-containing protein [Tanacetum coccineum]